MLFAFDFIVRGDGRASLRRIDRKEPSAFFGVGVGKLRRASGVRMVSRADRIAWIIGGACVPKTGLDIIQQLIGAFSGVNAHRAFVQYRR